MFLDGDESKTWESGAPKPFSSIISEKIFDHSSVAFGFSQPHPCASCESMTLEALGGLREVLSDLTDVDGCFLVVFRQIFGGGIGLEILVTAVYSWNLLLTRSASFVESFCS